MVEFPKIAKGQVAFQKADTRTGHILTSDNEIYRSNGMNIYMIFESLDEAKKYVIEERLNIGDWIEYTFFDSNQNMLLFIAGFNG